MNTSTTVVISVLVAASLFGAIGIAVPALATMSHEEEMEHNHLKFAKTYASNGAVDLFGRADHKIAKNGEAGAYGYGIITSEGLNAVMVATTHGGVKDSISQKNAADPVWHTHYVKLVQNPSGLCGNELQVADISFQQPANVDIKNKVISIQNLPSSFTGTSSLTGDSLTLVPGITVNNVVAFHLMPEFDASGNLAAVCVHDVMPADVVTATTVFKNEEDHHD